MRTIIMLLVASVGCIGCSETVAPRPRPTNAQLEIIAGEPVIAVSNNFCVRGISAASYGEFVGKVQDLYGGTLGVRIEHTDVVCAYSPGSTVPVPASFLNEKEVKFSTSDQECLRLGARR